MAPNMSLRRLAAITLKPMATVADHFAGKMLSPELQRALPDSKGGEEPKDLQRWHTDMFEMFTTTLGESVLFYSADQWVRVQLTLETAGPVAVSTRSNIVPTLSGKGRLLTTDVPYEVYLPKGSRLYYAAENVNRIATTFEPIPWMEQLSLEIRRVVAAVGGLGGKLISSVTGVAAPGRPPPASSFAAATPIQRLTKMEPAGKVIR